MNDWYRGQEHSQAWLNHKKPSPEDAHALLLQWQGTKLSISMLWTGGSYC